MKMKRCAKCQEIKPLAGFYKNKRNKDGVRYICIGCWNEQGRKHYQTLVYPPEVTGSKICPACKIEKPFTEFYKNKGGKDGLRSWCKDCTNKNNEEYYLKNKERIDNRQKEYRSRPEIKARNAKYKKEYYQRPEVKKKSVKRHRETGLLRKYGITFEQKQTMTKSQNGKCAICGCKLNNDASTHVDHDHETKKIRGILCGQCNRGLGCFKDNVRFLLSAVAYLEINGDE